MESNLLKIKFDKVDIRQLNPLTLAFVGDAVYDVLVRTYLINKFQSISVHNLHVRAIKFVKAHSQSEIIKRLEKQLSEEELYFLKEEEMPNLEQFLKMQIYKNIDLQRDLKL